MSRFREELRIVPGAGWVIAAAVQVGLGLLLSLLLARSPDSREWPLWLNLLASVLSPLPLSVYALLIAYIYRDAQRRAMRHVMWTLLAALIPNGIGIILYFVLRDPVLAPCATCGTMTKAGFAFCPKCGTALGKACPKCGRSVESDWVSCAYCGEALRTRQIN